jgi:hypothetical protein
MVTASRDAVPAKAMPGQGDVRPRASRLRAVWRRGGRPGLGDRSQRAPIGSTLCRRRRLGQRRRPGDAGRLLTDVRRLGPMGVPRISLRQLARRPASWTPMGERRGGGDPFYVGGRVVESDVAVLVRIRFSNGLVLEDVAGSDGIVLFPSAGPPRQDGFLTLAPQPSCLGTEARGLDFEHQSRACAEASAIVVVAAGQQTLAARVAPLERDA